MFFWVLSQGAFADNAMGERLLIGIMSRMEIGPGISGVSAEWIVRWTS